MDIEYLVYSLPSTQAFVSTVTDSTGNGVKIVLIPDNISRDMVGRLIRNRANSSSLRFDGIFDPGNDNPVTAASKSMNVSWPSQRTLRTVHNLMQCEGLPDILYVHRIGPARTWTEFIENWAREFGQLRKQRPAKIPSLCVIAKLRDFDFTLPADSRDISKIWWWGFPSSLEIRLACRIAGDWQIDRDPAAIRWREYVLPGLVGNDVQLAEYMWDFISDGTDQAVNSLAKYWGRLEDTEVGEPIDDVVETVHADRTRYEIGEGLPEHLWRLWAAGGLVYTPEYGLETHPAMLAHAGRHAPVNHMIWRGQSELLLPFVNEIRLKVCQDLTATFGSDWPIRWVPPRSSHEFSEVNRSPLSTEIGHINYLLQNLAKRNYRHDLYRKRNLGDLVLKAMRVRNEIAHYTPVSCRDFIDLYQERDNVGI